MRKTLLMTHPLAPSIQPALENSPSGSACLQQSSPDPTGHQLPVSGHKPPAYGAQVQVQAHHAHLIALHIPPATPDCQVLAFIYAVLTTQNDFRMQWLCQNPFITGSLGPPAGPLTLPRPGRMRPLAGSCSHGISCVPSDGYRRLLP